MGAWTSGDVSSGELSWGEVSRVGNRPGGELSCWGILVGTHLRGSCSVGRYPRTFK